VPRGSALLTHRLIASFLLFAGSFACRSAVAPPSPYRESGDLPSGIVSAFPDGTPTSSCPRRECPLPANLIAGLEERMLVRLDSEREGFLDGLDLLRAQRDAFVALLRDIVRQRRVSAPAPPTGVEDAPAERCVLLAAEASAAASVPVTELLEETAEWLEAVVVSAAQPRGAAAGGSVAPSPAPAAPAGIDAGPDGEQGGATGTTSAGIARAQSGPAHEGQWILPVVRMMARLRARFAAVADVQADSAALEDALRTAETRLAAALRLFDSAQLPAAAADGGAVDATASARMPALADAGHDVSSAPDESVRCAEEARLAARARAAADLRRALDGLERARPATCGTREGSAVCRPAPVDVWTGSEFTLVDPTDGQDTDRLLENLDQFLQP